MTQSKWWWGLSLVVAVGCGSDGGKAPARDAGTQVEPDASDTPDEEDDAGEDAGEAASKGRLRGRVTYADGTALGQVDITVQGKVVRSDSRGLFVADGLPEGEHQLSVRDKSVTAGQIKVAIHGDKETQASLSVLPLKKLPLRDVAAGGETVEPTDNIKLRLPSGGLRVKGSQQPATGAAEALYALLKSGSDLRAAPGAMRAMLDNRPVELESFAMLDMRFVQGDQELELTTEAELDLPLGPNTFTDQQEVDSYSFDAEKGFWKVDGRARIDKSAGGNGVAKLKPRHFSWWAVALPVEAETCVAGRLLSADGAALVDTWVEVVGQSYAGLSGAYTGQDGSFCVNVKQGSTSTLSAFALAAGVDAATPSSYLEWSQSVTASAAEAACGGDGCQQLGDLRGVSLFDECTGDVTSDQNHVLLLSSGDSALDTALTTGLSAAGHTVTLGAPYTMFDANVDLTPYDAVYLQANYNWSSGDMPLDGQRKLINWVNCGGGLVTVEWTTWKIGSGGTFELIDAIFPAARTTAYNSVASETYVKASADATLNAGLPDMFTFNTTSYAGTQSRLLPRPGATIYYDSLGYESGLLGWSYNLGRVASFSTTVGTNEVADPNFMRLIANTLDWAQRD